MPSKAVLCRGREGAQDRMVLRAGTLSMVFERDLGFLRYVRCGRTEILRGVYAALRDHNWDTIDPQVGNVVLDEGEDGFVLSFDVECVGRGIDFFWRGTISGGRGRVEFAMDGVARSDFRRNRLGFCVLHPAECAGLACRVERVDGTAAAGAFPRHISPHQPFMEMQSIAYEVDGVAVKVGFAGDVFEMEDQRNWTDASYKTYCTPLAVPFPVAVKEGEQIRQRISIDIAGAGEETAGGGDPVVRVGAGQGVALMDIGLGSASDERPLSEAELARLRVLNLAHLRVDLRLAREGWRQALARARAEALALGVGLEVAVFVSDAAAAELAALAEALGAAPVRRFLVFHEGEKSTTAATWVDLARSHLGAVGAAIGAGSDAYFTELNRGRPPLAALDFVSFSLNPQVHAFDDTSLAETLAAQPRTVESARQFCGAAPLVVTPVTLMPRFNPNATEAEPEPAAGQLPAQVDVRQMSLFGAGWTAASLKYLGLSGLASATYYETAGWRGVMERRQGSPLPAVFQSIAGAVFPLYHVLADVGEFAGGELVGCSAGDPLRVDGLALRQGGRRRLLLANLTGERVAARLAGWAGSARVRWLDERNVERAMREPEAFRAEAGERVGQVDTVELWPYGLARVDLDEEDGQ